MLDEEESRHEAGSSPSVSGNSRGSEHTIEPFSLEDAAEEQCQILIEGQKIEQFISEWGRDHAPDTYFTLLRVLFDLFKSEISASISLRRGLANLRRNVQLSNEYDEQLSRLLAAAQRFDPNVSNLSDVVALYRSRARNADRPDQANELREAQESLQAAVERYELQRRELKELQQRLANAESDWSQQLSGQQERLAKAMSSEKELRIRLNALQAEDAELQQQYSQLQSECDASELRAVIQKIDERSQSLQEKIQVLNARYRQKVKHYQARLDALAIEIEDLGLKRSQFEKELDRIQERIDWITNPLSACNDISISPHATKAHLGHLRSELESRQSQLKIGQSQIDHANEEIADLSERLEEVRQENQQTQSEIEKLREQKADKEKVVRSLEKERAELTERSAKLRRMDDMKRHIEAENIKLRQELEAVKAKARQLAIDNRSLRQSLDHSDGEITRLTAQKEEMQMGQEDIDRFNEVLGGFKMIRESLNLPSDYSPSEISSAVLEST
jgi:chromosome segregation ATPase